MNALAKPRFTAPDLSALVAPDGIGDYCNGFYVNAHAKHLDKVKEKLANAGLVIEREQATDWGEGLVTYILEIRNPNLGK